MRRPDAVDLRAEVPLLVVDGEDDADVELFGPAARSRRGHDRRGYWMPVVSQ